MSARCKPGDLAVVVGPCMTAGLVGRFVIVERIVLDGEEALPGVAVEPGGPLAWWCRSATDGAPLPWDIFGAASGQRTLRIETLRRPIQDQLLRPIRPNEDEDESLSWARPRVEETA